MNLFSGVLKNENGGVFFQYFASLSALLAIVSSGLHYGWPSPALTKLLGPNSEIPITDDEGFWLATMPLFGAFLGSLTAPVLVDNIGRRKTILMTSFPYLVSWILIFFATSVPILYIGRFTGGISDGWGFSSVPIYIGEISQPKIRGLLASGASVTFIFGILLINIVGSYLSVKMTALVACVLPVAMLLTFFWMPESPYFLIMKNRQEEAKKSLQTFIGPKLASTELTRIDEAVKEDLSHQTKSNPLQLFTVRRNYRAVLVMMLVRGAQQFSGASAIVFYAQNIFDEAGSTISAHLAAIMFFSIQVVCTIIGAPLVDKLGRRPLLLVSGVGACLALLVDGIYFYIKSSTNVDISNFTLVPIIALIVYIIIFSFGLQNVPIIIMSEIFNQDIKAVAMCFADMYFAAAATATSKFFQITRDQYGMYLPFLCFSILCGISTGFIYYFVPETNGKTLEEIQDHFKGKNVKKKENCIDDMVVV